MADKKISQLTGATTPLAGSEVLPIVQGGSTVKVSVDNLTAGKTVSAAAATLSGNLTLSGGTANGVLYLNASKVATSGSALAFDGTYFSLGAAWTTNPLRDSQPQYFQISTGAALSNIVGVSGAVLGIFRVQDSAASGALQLGHSRGTWASPTAVQSGDGLGDIQFQGFAGTNARTLGRILCTVDTYTSNTDVSAYLEFRTSSSGAASATEKLRITAAGNVKIGGTANRATTEGTAQLVLFNGTAPVGTLSNGVSIYSSSGEAYVMDAAGNATLFSPHDSETNEWIFKSKHTPTGKVLRIDVEKLLRFVNDHFGLDAVKEFVEV